MMTNVATQLTETFRLPDDPNVTSTYSYTYTCSSFSSTVKFNLWWNTYLFDGGMRHWCKKDIECVGVLCSWKKTKT